MTNDQGADAQQVMVIHGRNRAVRDAMYHFLRSLNLVPIEWQQAVKATGSASPTTLDVVNKAFEMATAVVVLMTGDDLAKLKPEFVSEDDPQHEKELTSQPRANVLFEAGMALALQRNRTVLVTIGTLRPFTDIAGVHLVRLDNTSEKRNDLAGRLQGAGCNVNRDGSDWLTAGNFSSDSFSNRTLHQDSEQSDADRFSEKEIMILRTIFQDGESSKTRIASSTGITKNEVHFHVRELLQKKIIWATRAETSFDEATYQIRPGQSDVLRRNGVIG